VEEIALRIGDSRIFPDMFPKVKEKGKDAENFFGN
jgi:hypothetical protein